jgi:hypothetical protein
MVSRNFLEPQVEPNPRSPPTQLPEVVFTRLVAIDAVVPCSV